MYFQFLSIKLVFFLFMYKRTEETYQVTSGSDLSPPFFIKHKMLEFCNILTRTSLAPLLDFTLCGFFFNVCIAVYVEVRGQLSRATFLQYRIYRLSSVGLCHLTYFCFLLWSLRTRNFFIVLSAWKKNETSYFELKIK